MFQQLFGGGSGLRLKKINVDEDALDAILDVLEEGRAAGEYLLTD